MDLDIRALRRYVHRKKPGNLEIGAKAKTENGAKDTHLN
jgi:hypothetical protein